MIEINIQENATATLQALAREYPKEIGKGMNTLGMKMRGQIKRELEAGAPARKTLAPLAGNTLAIRRLSIGQGKRMTKKQKYFGGALSGLVRYKYDKTTGTLKVGWMPGMQQGGDPGKAAGRFQLAHNRKITIPERIFFRLNKLKQEKTYVRPQREVISPYEDDAATKLDAIRIVAGRIRSIVEKKRIGS